MFTLRSYFNSIEAGLAKARLDEAEIPCSLADEGANAWGGAPMAMPIRLIVPEERVADALRVLKENPDPLPENFSPAPGFVAPDPDRDLKDSVLNELR